MIFDKMVKGGECEGGKTPEVKSVRKKSADNGAKESRKMESGSLDEEENKTKTNGQSKKKVKKSKKKAKVQKNLNDFWGEPEENKDEANKGKNQDEIEKLVSDEGTEDENEREITPTNQNQKEEEVFQTQCKILRTPQGKTNQGNVTTQSLTESEDERDKSEIIEGDNGEQTGDTNLTRENERNQESGNLDNETDIEDEVRENIMCKFLKNGQKFKRKRKKRNGLGEWLN